MHLSNRRKLKIFVNQSVVGYGVEAWSYLSHPFSKKHLPNKKFVVFGSGRSGSTLLTRLLDKHSQIESHGEILRRKMLYPQKYIQRCYQTAQKPVFGFKLLSYQLETVQNSIKDKRAFLSNLVEDGFQILYLERKNILRQALSVMYGYHRDQWHVKGASSKQASKKDKMKIDAVELKNWMDGIVELKYFEEDILQYLPHYHLVYEEDLSQPEKQIETIDDIMNYLGIEQEPLSSDLKKVTPKKLSSFVENADEVLDFLSASRYQSYIQMLEVS